MDVTERQTASADPAPTALPSARFWRLRHTLAAVAAAGTVAGGLAGYWNFYRTLAPAFMASAPSAQRAAAPRLSIVVLPFVNRGGDAAQETFADVLTEEVTAGLALVRDSFVIAPGTAFTFKGQPQDARRIGEALGVRYLLEGSVSRSGDTVQLDLRLVETASGRVLTSSALQAPAAGFADIRRQVAASVAESLTRDLVAAEVQRARSAVPVKPEAQDFRLQARDRLVQARTPADFDDAYRLYGEALALDPRYEAALDGQAFSIALQMLAHPKVLQQHPERLAEAEQKARAAAELDPGDADPRFTLAVVHLLQGRYAEGLAAVDAALALNPNLARAHATRANLLLATGRVDASIDEFRTALALSPRESRREWWLAGVCRGHLLKGEFGAAIEWCEKARVLAPADQGSDVFLAAAYAQTGEAAKAAQARARVLEANPEFRISRTAAWAVHPDVARRRERYLLPGLRKAGFAEEAPEAAAGPG